MFARLLELMGMVPDSRAESGPPLSENELTQISKAAERHLPYWNETSSSLSKWPLATLLTINGGAMLLTVGLGIHPDAVRNAGLWFFVGVVTALLAGVLELYRLEKARNFFFLVDFAKATRSQGPTGEALLRILRGTGFRGLARTVGTVSLFAFFLGGNTVVEAIRPCSAADYEVSLDFGGPYVPAGKGSLRYCYYYGVNGLPDEPLERARLERRMIDHLKRHGSWPVPKESR